MEVHHHAHTSPTPDPSTGSGHRSRKKWTHYFWEFLMLFLAVFCGFMAENIREHSIEKKREKIYMYNLVEDLRADTSAYIRYTNANESAFGMVDSLMYLMNSTERKSKLNRIYYLARKFTMRSDLLYTNTRTYDEMRSSGQLRLIHNRAISDALSRYYQSLKHIQNQNDRVTVRINEFFLTMGDIFDARTLLQISNNNQVPDNSSLRLLTEDTQQINRMLTLAQYLYSTFKYVETIAQLRLIAANKLIQLIKNEYNIRGE